jgi:hypothetical protein
MRSVKFLLFIVLVSVSAARAQVQLHLGATTAYNATFVLDKGLSEDPRYSATMTYNWSPIGFSFGADFGPTFGLSLEGIKSIQGQVYEMIDIAEKVSGERRIELSYIHMPLLAKFMSRSNSGARANFSLGPQLSFLTDATELVDSQAGEFEVPDGVDFESIKTEFPDATQTSDQAAAGTYSMPNTYEEIYTKEANDFKSTEFQIAAAFGVDIDLSRHLFITTQIRANYSLTDMRNGDVIEMIKNGDGADIFGQRANLIVGVQLGLHYMFGTTRSFKFKK